MLATKFNLQTVFGATRREAVQYHKTVGTAETEIDVDRLNQIKSQRKAKQEAHVSNRVANKK